ncbi:hypothetical protein LEN26_001980 [Aphanomyces euteiches]|nr:hypothetical protein LEN26_001980 [Aphanomyces euteiches]
MKASYVGHVIGVANGSEVEEIPAEIPFIALPVVDILDDPVPLVNNDDIENKSRIGADVLENTESDTVVSIDKSLDHSEGIKECDELVKGKDEMHQDAQDSTISVTCKRGHEENVNDETNENGQRLDSNRKRNERPQRERRLPKRFRENGCYLLMEEFDSLEEMTPKSYDDMKELSPHEVKKWEAAMDKEYNSLLENGTWILVERPNDRVVINNKWLYKIKRDREGNLRYKARLVIKGYEQIEGMDFDETFAPVVRFETLRFFLLYSAMREWKLRQYDFVTAFLNADMDDFDVYMEQPRGRVIKGNEQMVCLLQKSLYGLHQAPREWNSLLHCYLLTLGFERCEKDYGLYVKWVEENSMNDVIYLTIYVDDLVLLGEDELVHPIECLLTTKFKITQMGDLRYLLGIEIDYIPGEWLIFSQANFIRDIIRKFGNLNMNPIDTPQGKEKDPPGRGQEDDFVDEAYPYRSLVGCLQYLVTGSRLELANVVRTLAKYLNNYTMAHWKLAIRVLKYLVGTVNHGLAFDIKEALKYDGLCVETWVDSDWANDETDRKSITGYVTKVNGCTISSKSEKQDIIGTSTCHAETIAASTAARDIRWIEQLMDECYLSHAPSSLIIDNHGAERLCNYPGNHKRTKLIEVRHLYVRECVEKYGLKTFIVASDSNLADMNTKGPSRERFLEMKTEIGIVDTNQLLTWTVNNPNNPTLMSHEKR